MNLDWQKLFSGLGDFVTVMMPGMILLFTLTIACSDSAIFSAFVNQKQFSVSGSTESWVVFLVASYFLGHIIFLIGSFLDELVYDRIRRRTTLGQLQKLAEGRVPVFNGPVGKLLAKCAFNSKPDKAVAVAVRLKSSALGRAENYTAVNAYKWCKARLLRENPDGHAAVLRFESDSKFFRSMIIIMPFVVPACFWMGYWLVGTLTLFVLFPLIVVRYVEQRFKATEEAYVQVITLDAAKLASDAMQSGERAGGVVYQGDKHLCSFLLVQATSKPEEWVFPKGHVEPGETFCATAVREVLEETGVWARVICHLSDVEFGRPPLPPKTHFYLMERFIPPGQSRLSRIASWIGTLAAKAVFRRRAVYATPATLWSEDRQHQWLDYDSAKKALGDFEESISLLKQAAEIIADLPPPKQKQTA